MHSQAFVIELLEDLVISERAASLGGHRSLDYVPGQTLLGACAARLYRDLGDSAYAVFHSGAVRFGNACPLDTQGRPAVPMPLCWFQKKADAKPGSAWVDPARTFNLQFGDELLDGAQPKQLRNGYVNSSGELIENRRLMRMKTAIEPGTGRAAEAQFFGYHALVRGTRLGGWIEADDGINGVLFKEIIASLTGTLHLGRSRSAEYGRAAFAPSTPTFDPPEAGPGEGRGVTLWLLSDLALMDEHGQPTLEPLPAHLGLGTGAVDWSRTFIRTRRYAPWNRKRAAPDLERWVITQGSVLRLDLASIPDRVAFLKTCADGLGLYRECGLGRVWVDPPWLRKSRPPFPDRRHHNQDQGPASGAVGTENATAKDPLIGWLRSQVDGTGSRERIERDAKTLADEFKARLGAARSELGVPDLLGPSRSQWGRVLEAARSPRYKTGAQLLAVLFTSDDRVVKPTAEGWKEVFFAQSGRLTLAAWLEQRLRGYERPGDLPRLVQRLAHLCRTDMEQRAQ